MLSKHTHLSRKSLALLFSLIMICSVASSAITYVIAQGTPSTFTISQGVYPGSSTITIFPDSGNYYIKNSYGAISYQTANFTYAMEQAITDLGADGGGIYLSKGTYTLTSGDRILIWGKSNIHIYGDGPDTAITQSAGLNTVHFFQIHNSTNIIISNLRIDGAKTTQTGGTSAVAIGGSSANCKVTDCYINNMYNFGVQIYDSATYNWVTGNQISACTNNGISVGYSTRTAGFNTISQNNIYHVAFGVALYFADHNTVSGNQIQNNPAVAFNEGINLDSSSFNTVSGNQIVGTGDVGIAIHNQYGLGYSWYNTVSDNTIKAAKFHGIHLINYTALGSIENNIVSGNQIVDCNVAAGAYDGIKLESVRANNIINNMIIDDRGGSALMQWGIQEIGDYNLISGARCVGNTIGGIKTLGTNTKTVISWNASVWIP
jgi:parallel beta-helix repeat protein